VAENAGSSVLMFASASRSNVVSVSLTKTMFNPASPIMITGAQDVERARSQFG
jgi:hypothetical protein